MEFEVPIYYGTVKFATAVDDTVVQAGEPWLIYKIDPGAQYLTVVRALLSFGVLLPDPVLSLGLTQPGNTSQD